MAVLAAGTRRVQFLLVSGLNLGFERTNSYWLSAMFFLHQARPLFSFKLSTRSENTLYLDPCFLCLLCPHRFSLIICSFLQLHVLGGK